MAGLLRHPLAWLPMALSLAALGLLLGCAVGGTCAAGAGGDEGAAARVFQLLLVAQAFIVVIFAVRWLPERPRAAAAILAAQVLLASIAVIAVLWLEG